MRYSCTPSRHIQAKAARKQKCKMPAMMEHTSWWRRKVEMLPTQIRLVKMTLRLLRRFTKSENSRGRFCSDRYFWLFHHRPAQHFYSWISVFHQAGEKQNKKKKRKHRPKANRKRCRSEVKSQVNMFQTPMFLVQMPSFHWARSQPVFPWSCTMAKVTKGGIT